MITGVSTGIDTITKPYTDYTYTYVTKTKTRHSNIVTSIPKTTSSPCPVTKPYTSTSVSTGQKCTTKKGW